jgi:hypothetical protein
MPLGVTVGRTLSRVAGIVSAGALITFAAAPAALAQETDTTVPSTTETTTSETTTTTVPTTTSETTAPTTPTTSSNPTTSPTPPGEVKTTDKRIAPKAEPELKDDTQTPPPADDYQDNTGHGFVGLGGEGVLVINCAAGAPGNLATQYLEGTGGPDQDGADGRLWNYTVRVANLPAGTTTGKFSWTCGGVDGEGVVDFEQEQQPPTSTTPPPTSTTEPTTTSSAPSSTAPVITSSVPSGTTTTTAPGNAAPKAQVKVAPQGGVDTGFGGMAW